MTTSTPKTIAQVFRTHGIGIGISAPIMQIQELAMAVSLSNRYRVTATYQGLSHTLMVTVYEPSHYPDIIDEPWLVQRHMAAAFPTHESDELQQRIAIQDLGGIADTLRQLLKEGRSS